MRIQVSGKQIDIGEALRTHVEDRLGEAVAKYFDRPVEAVVTFCKDRHEFVADSLGAPADRHDRAGHRPGRRDLRLASRARSTGWRSSSAATSAGSRTTTATGRIRLKRSARRPTSSPAGRRTRRARSRETLQPVIVAEMETRVPFLSVGEAVMQMELAGRASACLPQRGAWRGQRRPPARRRQHRLDRPAEHPVGAEAGKRSVRSWSYRRSSASTPCARR